MMTDYADGNVMPYLKFRNLQTLTSSYINLLMCYFRGTKEICILLLDKITGYFVLPSSAYLDSKTASCWNEYSGIDFLPE